ncbi:Microcin-A immunity protein [Serratia quinivorans]|uniref:colicin immunity protein Cui n=1 Tax=Serratia quinivorans TaxID=137545 RepID=UPI002176F9D5|nr:colicin immunity protein Cui [Serratia quinivorans]CAI1494434.1 Microcin-A immunity protein [Serratia quinivorans]
MNSDALVWKKFAQIGLIGVAPLIILFTFFKLSPDNSIFIYFSDLTKDFSANISTTNLALTKPLAFYCKVAPFFSLYFAAKHINQVKSKPNIKNMASMVFYSIGFVAVYLIMFYIFVVGQFDMNNGNRLLKATASNDYTIILYYIIVFAGMYTLTFILLMLVRLLYSEFRKSIIYK